MSYFPDIDKHEIDEGVFIERRSIMKVSAFAIGSLLLGAPRPLIGEISQFDETLLIDDGSQEADPALSFKKMIQKISPKAKALIKSKKPDEEAYLKELVSLVKQCKGLKLVKSNDRKIQFTDMKCELPLKVYQIRLSPGAELKLHDHRHYNGVIQTLKGSAKVRNFDFVKRTEDIYEADSFNIKETQNTTITKGSISNLTRHRDNIHEIKAGKEGVTFLDIFTFFNKKASSAYLTLDSTAVDKDKKIYKAEWTKRKKKKR